MRHKIHGCILDLLFQDGAPFFSLKVVYMLKTFFRMCIRCLNLVQFEQTLVHLSTWFVLFITVCVKDVSQTLMKTKHRLMTAILI